MAKRVSEFCLEELLGEIADEIGPRLTAAGLEPVYDLHPAIPAWLHGNGQELRRALMRQCDQAIAHRWRGELIIDLRPVSAAPRQLVIACLVRPWWPDTDGVPAATAGDSMHWRARESSHPDAAAAPDPQRVLLVDHRPGTRQVNSRYLRRLRCTVFQAEDANEAVQLLAAMSRAPDTLIINLALEDAPDANPALRVLRC